MTKHVLSEFILSGPVLSVPVLPVLSAVEGSAIEEVERVEVVEWAGFGSRICQDLSAIYPPSFWQVRVAEHQAD